MANRISSLPSLARFLFLLLIFLLCPFSSWNKSHGVEGNETTEIPLRAKSLLASVYCDQSSKVYKAGASLEVVHRYGPCVENLGREVAKKAPSDIESLLHDQRRAESIQDRARKSKKSKDQARDPFEEMLQANLPVQSGAAIGTGNYLVKLGLGTPKQDLTLIFDTGSDVTWTQCQPCVGSCYQQIDPIFDPVKSNSYRNVSCSSSACTLITGSGGAMGCSFSSSFSTCLYAVAYGDDIYSIGFFATEKLTITPIDTFSNYLFGCGASNIGTLVQSAGILGLGRKQLSLVSQTSSKYNKLFSYCIPSSSSSTGHLTFGGKIPSNTKFTPLSQDFENSLFYGLDTTGIIVGGQSLAIDESIFKNAGGIIDSGTVITRLPPSAYSKLSAAFQSQMKDYTRTSGVSILDTCYDFSNQAEVIIPLISFLFKGGVKVDIDASGIMIAVGGLNKVCLAFAGNGDDTDVAIFGNAQQKTYEVVYDGAEGRVGFGPGGCQ